MCRHRFNLTQNHVCCHAANFGQLGQHWDEKSRNVIPRRIQALLQLVPLVRGRTHVRIKGQNLNFYLENHATPHNIHATPHNIYFIRLRILPRILGTLYWRVDDPLLNHNFFWASLASSALLNSSHLSAAAAFELIPPLVRRQSWSQSAI